MKKSNYGSLFSGDHLRVNDICNFFFFFTNLQIYSAKSMIDRPHSWLKIELYSSCNFPSDQKLSKIYKSRCVLFICLFVFVFHFIYLFFFYSYTLLKYLPRWFIHDRVFTPLRRIAFPTKSFYFFIFYQTNLFCEYRVIKIYGEFRRTLLSTVFDVIKVRRTENLKTITDLFYPQK